MRILILEDDLDLLQCTRSYFLERGHQVVTASTVAEAKRLLDGSPLELVLVDLLLPNGHGRQIVQEIARRGLPIRVVVITASDDLQLRREMKLLGVRDYLFKPLTVRDLDALFEFDLPSA